MTTIEQELKNLFSFAADDLSKGKDTIELAASLENCSNRFIKLSKRLYDIYRLYDEEFAVSLDVVAAKSLLHFTRACFTVTHVLRQNNWLALHEVEPIARKIKSLPRRAAHKVWKRAFQKRNFIHDDEEYKQSGIAKVIHQQNKKKRNYTDELSNIAIALKDMGTSLLLLAKASGLVNLASFNMFGKNEAKYGFKFNVEEYTLDKAKIDLEMSHNILQDYYVVVLQEMEQDKYLNDEDSTNKTKSDGAGSGAAADASTASAVVSEGDADNSKESTSKGDPEELATSDECLLPLMDKYNMKKRPVLRGYINYKLGNIPSFQDLNNTMDDLYDVCKMLCLLDYGPAN